MKIAYKAFVMMVLMMIAGNTIMAQQKEEKYQVTIIIHNNDRSTHIGEQFYLTGSFNNWKPADVLIGRIPAFGESVEVKVSAPKGLFEYKFNRGNWETLASTSKGTLEGPIKVNLVSDTTVRASIDGWRDDFPASTASPQVHLINLIFHFPKLNVHRRVWVYLPEDYEKSNAKYPVLYMHDGQDLFDEATSKGRIGPLEWQVDEAIDRAAKKAIVVAVAHAEDIQQRQNEYFVQPTSRFPNPVGEDYLADIVEVLKPYIDRNYRTKSDRKHTAMAGSSVGGLLTFYAGLKYPEVFGTVGVLSPSIWLDEGNIAKAIDAHKVEKKRVQPNFYFYGGGNENRLKPDGTRVQMHDDINDILTQLRASGRKEVEVTINPEGRHGAWYWQKAFPHFYDWWMQKQ